MTVTLETDHLGFLLDARSWSRDWCLSIADQQRLSLTDQDLAIVESLREFYFEYDLSPAMRPLVRHLKGRFGPDVGNSIFLMQRFGESPARMLALLAGLPKPKNCL
ncbi:TusE/DsrC/DsvC family sulfur relay protein [Saccharospirillum impatiens]|uniref:TusE/DsrC/DsvC family sulfur relay protein n=1 Tax=Saccharospirillum impatiens TaxID=169438 RepID=UPI000421757F|nr:TusE/DsrC/DsvC family sulfur relay protein [Saccharospirillum impatiens]